MYYLFGCCGAHYILTVNLTLLVAIFFVFAGGLGPWPLGGAGRLVLRALSSFACIASNRFCIFSMCLNGKWSRNTEWSKR